MITMQTFARECFQKSTDSLLKTFAAVPDDKLSWSPSSTSRSALELVTHIGVSNHLLADLINEGPVRYKDAQEFLTDVTTKEKTVKERQEALSLIEHSSPRIVSAINSVPDTKLEETINTIFGPHPMRKIIFFPDWHLSAHLSQLQYLQTVWGDLAMHG